MVINNKSRRLISYAFYDRDGIVDSYVLYVLEHLLVHCEKLILVSNGDLTPDSRSSLDALGVEYIERPNKGLDISGHRELMSKLGWEELSKYDEFIMTNDTMMGPVKPLDEFFGRMNVRDVDFWGLSSHSAGKPEEPYDNKYGYLPTHLQSYFIAIRKNLLGSNDFREYWETMPEIKSYNDAVNFHETVFTKHFSDLGYSYESYIPLEALDDYSFYPMLFCPVKLIDEFDCPFFKKRSFFNDYFISLHTCYADQARELYDYLRERTDYDVNMIWDNILRVDCMSDIQNNLNLCKVLPSEFSIPIGKDIRLALHIDIRNKDCIGFCYNHALSMPENSDIYVSTPSDCRKAAQERFEAGPWNSITFLDSNADSADWYIPAELLDKFADYDYVCTLHDIEEVEYPEHMSLVGEAHTKRYTRNLLGTRSLVANIINEFEANPRLGVIASPMPYISDYYHAIGDEWDGTFDFVREFAWRMGLSAPAKKAKAPALADSCCFWFRPTALSRLFEYINTHDSALSSHGTTFRHAADRIVPLVAQDAGFYTEDTLSDKNADSEVRNLRYIVQTLNQQISDDYEIGSMYSLLLLMELPYPKYLFKKKVHDIIGEERWVKIRDMYHKHGGKFWLG